MPRKKNTRKILQTAKRKAAEHAASRNRKVSGLNSRQYEPGMNFRTSPLQAAALAFLLGDLRGKQ